MKEKLLIVSIGFILIISSCNKVSKPEEKPRENSKVENVVPYPEWVKSSTIYEVNIRQYSEEGNFEGFIEHLPRLKEQGVDIL